MDSGGGGHLASNRAQLKKACRGALPYGELKDLVGDGEPVRSHEHGTLVDPGRRAARCWTARWTGAAAGASPCTRRPSSRTCRARCGPRTCSGRRQDGVFVSPGTTGMAGGRGAWLVAECEKGLRGRVRPTTDLYVEAAVTPAARARVGWTGRAPSPTSVPPPMSPTPSSPRRVAAATGSRSPRPCWTRAAATPRSPAGTCASAAGSAPTRSTGCCPALDHPR
ncbi:hypothetical protein NKH77_36260 [Streptomyces sp. M19]